MTTAAANLRQLRTKRQMTKRELARAAGLEESFYGKVERGERNASMPGWESLAKALGVPLAALFAEPAQRSRRRVVSRKPRGGGSRARRVVRCPAGQAARESTENT